MLGTTLTALGVGFALGMKHALDADHLAAVAVLVGERRGRVAGASAVGIAWGLGHASALTAVSLGVVLLGLRVPGSLALWMEFVVGVVLALLGARMIWRYRSGAVLHAHAHDHGERHHSHPHVHPRGIDHAHTSHHELPGAARAVTESRGRGPFLVGLLHGMAGSAALTVLILAAIPGTFARLGYVVVFGAGSILGMALMSTLVGWPLASGRFTGARPQRLLRLAAGSLSLGMGLHLMAGIAPEFPF